MIPAWIAPATVMLSATEPAETATAAEFVAYFDAASPEDLRWFFDELGDVRLVMAYLHRCGYQFAWYQRAGDAPASLRNRSGLSWWNSIADGPRAARSGEHDRLLLESWAERIKAHVYDQVTAGGASLEPGYHPVLYRLMA